MNKAIFLDRDGVINEVLSKRVKFVNKPSEFYLLPRVGEAVKRFNDLGYKIFVVTNQGGIGLGYMNHQQLEAIHLKMKEDLATYEAKIDGIAYCAHKPQAGCACRKPKPEMIVRLAKKHQVHLPTSYLVGDRMVDIEAGKKAGTTTVHVGDRDVKAEAHMHFSDLFSFSSWLVEDELTTARKI